ncbi:Protein FYV10 [Smittium mucronatum]|uniref:Protein FYV10 n=1 Tax=Smittium mucronatum TaxID=133383 RepID=A0A1R0H6F6_9FUNG|nr:Protein FYV10 [Smittium mucronatum]
MTITLDKSSVENSISIESPFMKVAVEKLKKVVRNSQKQIEKEMNVAIDLIDQINNVPPKIQEDETRKFLYSKLLEKLLQLQEEIKFSKEQESSFVKLINQRALEYSSLDSLNPNSPEYTNWRNKRLDRFLMDYMMRSGYQESATVLAKCSGLTSFSDNDIFERLISIDNSLRKNQNCSECLSWCLENKISLRKMNVITP